MTALRSRCGHYIFALWFLTSSFLSFYSSTNLSGRRFDVYHTSTHGVALVQVWNVLHAARWKCRTQKIAKNLPSGHHRRNCWAISLQLRHVLTVGKKLVKQQYLPHLALQYGELRPPSGRDRFFSLGHPSKFQLVSGLGLVTARHCSSGHQPNFAALNRGRHLYSPGRPSRWALAHILVCVCFCCSIFVIQMNVCFCCVRFSFFSTVPRDWLGERLWNDLFCCAEWDIKPCSQSHSV